MCKQSLNEFKNILMENKHKDIVFLCFGSEKHLGDSVGPLIGTKLKENGVKNVYGDLKGNLTAEIIKEEVPKILSRYKDPFVVCIDACGVEKNDIGKIFYLNEPLRPASAMYEDLGVYGDYSIQLGTFDGNSILRLTEIYISSLNLILTLADKLLSDLLPILTEVGLIDDTNNNVNKPICNLDDFLNNEFIKPKSKSNSYEPDKFVWDDFKELAEYKKEIGQENFDKLYFYTLIECEDNQTWIIPGYRYINRMGYFISKNKINIVEDGIRYL